VRTAPSPRFLSPNIIGQRHSPEIISLPIVSMKKKNCYPVLFRSTQAEDKKVKRRERETGLEPDRNRNRSRSGCRSARPDDIHLFAFSPIFRSDHHQNSWIQNSCESWLTKTISQNTYTSKPSMLSEYSLELLDWHFACISMWLRRMFFFYVLEKNKWVSVLSVIFMNPLRGAKKFKNNKNWSVCKATPHTACYRKATGPRERVFRHDNKKNHKKAVNLRISMPPREKRINDILFKNIRSMAVLPAPTRN